MTPDMQAALIAGWSVIAFVVLAIRQYRQESK